jgi:hypothetical protein
LLSFAALSAGAPWLSDANVLASRAAQAEITCHRTNVEPVADPEIAYRARGNRCEGIYAQPVSTSARLQIVGFHAGEFPITPLGSNAPVVSVRTRQPNSSSDVLLQAIALRPLTFYAMDTTQLARDGTFNWDTSLLASSALALRANELGIVACTALCNPAADPVYLPVAMTAPAGRRQSDYFIVVQAQRELSSIDYEVTAGERRVRSGNVAGPFPSRRPIIVPVGALDDGEYYLRLTGRADDGSRSPVLIRIRTP